MWSLLGVALAFRRHSLLIATVVLAASVRLWGIRFGLPMEIARPDEAYLVTVALGFGGGSLNPNTFIYPTFPMYFLFLLYGLYFTVGIFSGRYQAPADLGLEYRLNPSVFYLMARLVSVGFGVLSVVLLYFIAKRLFDRRTASLSSFFLSLAYLHVRESHFGTVDVAATFWLLVSFYFIIRSLTERGRKSVVLSGVFAGLAAATKYIGILLVLPIALASFFRAPRRAGSEAITLFVLRRITLFGAAFLLAFLIGVPFALLDLKTFLSDVMLNARNLDVVWGNVFLGRGWWFNVQVALFYGLGWSLFAASMLGMLSFLRRYPAKAVVFLAFPIFYFVLAGKGYAVMTRYMVPIVPFLCILGAVFVRTVGTLLKLRGRRRMLVEIMLAVIIVLPSARTVFEFDRLLSRTDSRLLVLSFLDSHLANQNSVYQTAATLLLPPTKEDLERKVGEKEALGGMGNLLRARILEREIRIRDERGHEGFVLWTYDPSRKKFFYAGDEEEGLPGYIVVERSPLRGYSTVPEGIPEILERSYLLVARFAGVDAGSGAQIYDQQDRFYVPFVGFSGLSRPGPGIEIYERVEG